MFISHEDYANNEYSLIKALKKQYKTGRYRYKDVEATAYNNRITAITLTYIYSCVEYGGWRPSVTKILLNEKGEIEDDYAINSPLNDLTIAWAEHIKQIKLYRLSLIEKELLQRTLESACL